MVAVYEDVFATIESGLDVFLFLALLVRQQEGGWLLTPMPSIPSVGSVR